MITKMNKDGSVKEYAQCASPGSSVMPGEVSVLKVDTAQTAGEHFAVSSRAVPSGALSLVTMYQLDHMPTGACIYRASPVGDVGRDECHRFADLLSAIDVDWSSDDVKEIDDAMKAEGILDELRRARNKARRA